MSHLDAARARVRAAVIGDAERVLLYPSLKAMPGDFHPTDFVGVLAVHPCSYGSIAEALRKEGYSVHYVHEASEARH